MAREKRNRCDCGRMIGRTSTRCVRCAAVESNAVRRKAIRPSREQLAEEISSMSWCAIGRKYGVSDNAVRKWARGYGLL